MARLKFKDINEWTPSSISIVDEPSHPLCHFEVYEDDDEYVKKSIDITGSEIMAEPTGKANEEGRVSVSESFLEKLLGKSITKSTEPPAEPPAQPPKPNNGDKSAAEKIMEKLEAMDKKIDALDGRVSKLETDKDPEPPKDGDEGNPAPGAVGKNDDSNNQGNDPEPPEDNNAVLDTRTVIAKSQELDPDNSTVSTTNDSFMKRTGRNSKGMTW